MDITTIVGLELAWGCFFGSVLMEGGSLSSFMNPSALVLVFGGTMGATLMSFPLSQIKKLPMIMKNAFMGSDPDVSKTIKTLVHFAERARREGLLALEDEAKGIDDAFLQKG